VRATWNKTLKVVTITWAPSNLANDATYNIFRANGTNPPLSSFVLVKQNAPAFSYNDATVRANSTYTYIMVTVSPSPFTNGTITSDRSNSGVVTTK
jgi:hypothetical protein